jgi:hypothetical protein
LISGGEESMSKDQAIGAAIVIVCVVVALAYVGLLFFYDPYILSIINIGSQGNVQFWLIAAPVAIAFIAILGIGSWIDTLWQQHRRQNQSRKSQPNSTMTTNHQQHHKPKRIPKNTHFLF